VSERVPETVGLIGGGVIGGGWAARFVLHGLDVQVYDPSPEAERRVLEILSLGRRAWSRLTLLPLPAEGQLTFVPTIEEAVKGADFIQESTPEREDLKREVLARASATAGAETVIASSTSGLLPTKLQSDMVNPERLVVGHPFNPVYLLPLVEVCGGEKTAESALQRAEKVYRAVGMSPLRVRKEVPGFIADRLLEAQWREALWLVADDIATASEIDDAIRLGPGLRWSVMGTFLIYRIAGGEAGMRHFMEQFGPTLQWPWSKLTDVPELSEAFVEKIAAQSDSQAGGRSIRELEQARDDALVSIMHGLRSNGAGAGAVLAAHERSLFDVAHPRVMDDGDDISQPLRLHRTRIAADWVDYNGHMTESRYSQVLADASDAFVHYLGVDATYLARGCTFFTAESHLFFLNQTRAEDLVEVSTQVLGADEKRLHLFHRLESAEGGVILAESEQMLLHVDLGTGRTTPAGGEVQRRVSRIAEAHARLSRPERAGRRVGDRKS
jgi:carnitine 3-dehydrogenase